MSTDFNNLLQEIYDFEEKANEHRQKLHDVKQKIHAKEKELKELKLENDCLNGHLAVKAVTLSEHEGKLTCMLIRTSVTKDQCQKLSTQKADLIREINSEKEIKERLRQSFCERARKLCEHRDILSDSTLRACEQKRSERTAQLEREIEQSKACMGILREKLAALESIQTQRVEKNQEHREILQQLKDAENILASEKSELLSLDGRIRELESTPEKSTQFKKLRFEISRLQKVHEDARTEQLRWSQRSPDTKQVPPILKRRYSLSQSFHNHEDGSGDELFSD